MPGPAPTGYPRSVIKQAFMAYPSIYQRYPMIGMGVVPQNTFGHPQDAFNNYQAINPAGYFRPGVGPGIQGMMMSPTAAMGLGAQHPAMAGMGMMRPGFGYGMNGFGGMGMQFGVPAMTEDQLQHQWQRQTDLIQNLAGQINPQTGRQYQQAEIERMLSSLNAQTTRSLQTIRSVQQQQARNPLTAAPRFGGNPVWGASPGYFGGGMMGMPFGTGMLPHSNRDLDNRRDRVRDLQTRVDMARLSNTPQISYEQVQEARQRALNAARNTSYASGVGGTDVNPYIDPLTNEQIRFGRQGGILGFLPSGETMNSGEWLDFRNAWDDYKRLHRDYRAGQQQRGRIIDENSTGMLADERRRLAQEEQEFAANRQRQQQLNDQLQQRWMHTAFPTTGQQYGLGGQHTAPGTAGGAPPMPSMPELPNQPVGQSVEDRPKLVTSSARVPITTDQLAVSIGRGLYRQQVKQAARPAIKAKPTPKKPVVAAMPARSPLAPAVDLARITAYLTGGGALAGGVSGLASAPFEYWPEAFMRGAGTGAATGAGVALGSRAGRLVGKGLSNPALFGSIAPPAGTIAGGLVGGGLLGRGALKSMPQAPWQTGEIPALEKLDMQARPRSPVPPFGLGGLASSR